MERKLSNKGIHVVNATLKEEMRHMQGRLEAMRTSHKVGVDTGDANETIVGYSSEKGGG